MTIKKVFDTMILIRLLQEIDGAKVFNAWNLNSNYELWITKEIESEVKTKAKDKLEELIEENVIKVFEPAPLDALLEIKKKANRLSLADSSIFYQCRRLTNSVCLSDDNPLRKHFKRNGLNLHGTLGIYLKLIRDETFPIQIIENMFKELLSDPRIFPKA